MHTSGDAKEVGTGEIPALLRQIPQPPTSLTYRGALPPPELPLLTVVGSRQHTTYGQQVVEHLINGLRDCQVGIVSGLALGIDSLAHEAALRNGLYTLAIPGSGLADDVLYPRAHRPLARRIIDAGGGLLSEFPADFRATKWSFIQRNRLMAGIAHATLVIEATARSGTLTTARMCVDYNRELLVVPGNIFSETSRGPHLFLKLGATPVTTAADIIEALNLHQTPETQTETTPLPVTAAEAAVLAALREPLDLDALTRALPFPAPEVSVLLMTMELNGHITHTHGLYRRLV